MHYLKVVQGPELDDTLVLPFNRIFDGSHTVEAFRMGGEASVREYIINRARLKPDESVLDVGCGIGKIARPLTGYLSEKGSYQGIEIVLDGVKWCQEHYAKYKNFKFHHADLYSSHYNRQGSQFDYNYRFPFGDRSFDLVVLRSVFTHMLERGVKNYVSEISRILRSGGRCYMTGFFLNADSLRRTELKMGDWHFLHPHGTARLLDAAVPEKGVAHDEAMLRTLFSSHGLDLADATYGNWCGRNVTLPTIQDAWILVKA